MDIFADRLLAFDYYLTDDAWDILEEEDDLIF